MRDLLTEIVGAEGVLPPEAAARWAVHGIVPRAVVAPASAEEAAAVLARASAEGWVVEPAGAGGWLGAGRRPERVDLVVTTARMAGAVEHEPADLVATAAAGVRLGALAARLASHRQWLPLDPPAHAEATLGAVASLAAAGPLREGHGTPRDHVLGVRLVTGDGRVLDLGGKVVKNVAGYDLVRLVVGSRGTLGLITRLHLRLRPLPERDATLAVPAPSFEPLVELAGRICEERIQAAALEIVAGAGRWGAGEVGAARAGAGRTADEPGAARRAGGGGGDDAPPWTLLVRLQGNAEAVADAEARVRRLADAVGRPPAGGLAAAHGRAGPAGPATTPGSAGAWEGLAALEAGAELCVRLADAPARLDRTLRLALGLPGVAGGVPSGRAPGAPARVAAGAVASAATDIAADTAAGAMDGVALMAHAGAGIVRVAVRAPEPGSAFDADRWARALEDARAALAGTGGSLIVARAPAALLRRFEPFADPGPALRLMRELKAKFDPAGVLAPGRFVV
ncbi:MAG TPA: FAD-binding oxidoreductase [Longimicrobiales bacterium]